MTKPNLSPQPDLSGRERRKHERGWAPSTLEALATVLLAIFLMALVGGLYMGLLAIASFLM